MNEASCYELYIVQCGRAQRKEDKRSNATLNTTAESLFLIYIYVYRDSYTVYLHYALKGRFCQARQKKEKKHF